MCSRGSSASSRLMVILVICICGLALHFLAEGSAPTASAPGFDLAVQGGHVHLAHEHCEDNFIFPILTGLPAGIIIADRVSLLTIGASAFSISPLLPPPNS